MKKYINYIPESQGIRRGLSRHEFDLLLALLTKGVHKDLIAIAMERTVSMVDHHLAPHEKESDTRDNL